MTSKSTALLAPTLALAGLALGCILLWNQTSRFRTAVESLADNIRVTLISSDGTVVYDTEGKGLPNHLGREEVELVRQSGRAQTIIRESATLHQAMLYHARRVGDSILRIAIPYQAFVEAREYAVRGLAAAGVSGALIVAFLFILARRNQRRLERLTTEHALQEKVLGEMRKLENFRRDFVSNVTHEIRTPVTGIIGAVELLSDTSSGLSAADRDELHGILRDQSKRLNALVNDILSLAKLEQAETAAQAFELCNVADIAETAVVLARPAAARAGITLTFENKTGAPVQRPCDPRLIEEAITNLITNALRYSGSSSVGVTLARTANDRAEIEVVDHGIGIPLAAQPHIFERFYRVDKARSRSLGGTGLGLAIVKHILQLHHGEAKVSSAPGVGSTFTLVF